MTKALTGPIRRHRTLNVLGAQLPTNVVFAICIALYLTAAAFVFAGTNADEQWNCHHHYTNTCDEGHVAEDRGMAAFMALTPMGWMASFFMTGGFHQGFSFEATPHIPSRD
jgi:hypothetical protein